MTAGNPRWYHTIELRPGEVTPGMIDLRRVAPKVLPPDLSGRRALDVGTYDGFWAFELERRGAEVVATDVAHAHDADWPPHRREELRAEADRLGVELGLGFRLAAQALGSRVRRVACDVRSLDAEAIGGPVDLIFCGALLLHLRDPLRALERIRGVCREWFLSAEQIDLQLSVLRRGRPVLRLDGVSELVQWFIPNAAAHRRLLEAAGFTLERWSRPYSVPFGEGHPPIGRDPRSLARRAARRILTRGWGVPHQAVLARV